MAISKAQDMAKAPNRWQDRTGKWLFSVFAFLGLGIILWIEWSHISKLVSMSICTFLLITYAVLTYWIPAMRARADQIGDNVYYLGLLYTLMSLAAAIVRLADDPDAADSILRNFGIALVTTIAGLMLRVILSQMRDDPGDVERETRANLAELTRTLRREMSESSKELRNFQFELKQMVDEASTTTLSKTTKLVDDASAHFTSATEQLTSSVSDQLVSVTTHNDTLDEAQLGFAKNLEEMAARLSKIDIDTNTFVQPISGAMVSLETAMTTHADKIAAQTGRIETAMLNIETLGQQADRMVKASEALTLAAEDIRTTGAAAAEMQGTIGQIIDNLSGFSQTVDAADQSVAAFSDRAAVGLASTLDAIDARQSASMEDFANMLETLKTKMSDLDSLSASFLKSGGHFADRMSEGEETLIQVRGQLADLAEYIIKRLERT